MHPGLCFPYAPSLFHVAVDDDDDADADADAG